MRDEKNRVEGIDAIARLVRLAGPRTESSAEGAERVRAEVERVWRARIRRRRRIRYGLAAGGSLAAAAAIVLLLGVVRPEPMPSPAPGPSSVSVGLVERIVGSPRVEGSSSRPLHTGMEIVGGETLVTDSRGRLALRLDSGHSIRIDRDSRLRFEGADRLVLESGAVYVDSAASRSSVEVVTDRGLVEEIGTQFEVRVLAEALRVRVREGEIRLHREGEEDRAGAGSELSVAGDGTVRRGEVAPHDPDWLWTQEIAPVFALEGRSLGEFLTWISRETGRDVRFDGSGLRADSWNVELHGDLEAMSPEQALAAVLPTCGLRFRARDDRYLIEESP